MVIVKRVCSDQMAEPDDVSTPRRKTHPDQQVSVNVKPSCPKIKMSESEDSLIQNHSTATDKLCEFCVKVAVMDISLVIGY